MIRIGLISDTHNYIDDHILNHFKDCDEIWHAGDIGTISVADQLAAFKPLKAVYGNIDGQDIRIVYPKNQRFVCEGLDVWMTHIGGYPNHYPMLILNNLKSNPPDLFICGHSHILKVMYDKQFNFLHMNPGAAGKHGFHPIRTILRFAISKGTIKNLEIIELGKRN